MSICPCEIFLAEKVFGGEDGTMRENAYLEFLRTPKGTGKVVPSAENNDRPRSCKRRRKAELVRDEAYERWEAERVARVAHGVRYRVDDFR